MAQNALVQGSAADIFKLVMIDVDDALGLEPGDRVLDVGCGPTSPSCC